MIKQPVIRAFLIGTILLLAGCGVRHERDRDREFNQTVANFSAAREQCDAQFPKRPGSYAANARCIINAQDKTSDFTYPDLMQLAQTTRTTLAAKVDKREISPEQ